MKLISLLVLALTFQTANACDENGSAPDCKDSGITTVPNLEGGIKTTALKTLSARMCAQLQSSLAEGHANFGDSFIKLLNDFRLFIKRRVINKHLTVI